MTLTAAFWIGVAFGTFGGTSLALLAIVLVGRKDG